MTCTFSRSCVFPVVREGLCAHHWQMMHEVKRAECSVLVDVRLLESDVQKGHLKTGGKEAQRKWGRYRI